jgi:hypothetical protein
MFETIDVKEFNKWFDEWRKHAHNMSERDIARAAFVSGWHAAQQGVQADCLPCGHPKEAAMQMEFGSWSCQMCKAANSR